MPLNHSCRSLMLRLFNIAFQSRYTLFLLISSGCMVFGVHLQIELEIGGGVQHIQPPLLDSQQREQHENEL